MRATGHPGIEREHFRTPLRQSPFHPRLAELSRQQRWIRWAGYLSAELYENVEQEYFAIRNQASVYDVSPLCKYRIHGPDAERFANRLVTRDVARLAPGRVAYVVWCNDAGRVIDDGTLFRLETDDFLLCAQEHHLAWLVDSAIGQQVAVEDVAEEVCGLSLQGPTSCAVLKRLGLPGIERLRPFGIARFALDGIDLSVSRTGFTGDLGYELWLDPADALPLWDRLVEAGRDFGLRPIGSQALDMARIEAGFIMTGVDFLAADHLIRPNRGRSPLELGLERLVDFKKGHFVGRRALLKEQETGASRWRLVGLDVAGNKPAANALLYSGKETEIGQVTSALWSPTAKKNIAIASIEARWADGSKPIWADIYVQKELRWRRAAAECRIVERPFYNPPRRSAVPAPER
jgi:aminomethyltransferase